MTDVDWKQFAYTVGELKQKLNDFPDDAPVIMSKDAEGNGHSPLGGIWPAYYRPESSWSGDILDTEDNHGGMDYNGDPQSFEEYIEGATPVLLLGPVN